MKASGVAWAGNPYAVVDEPRLQVIVVAGTAVSRVRVRADASARGLPKGSRQVFGIIVESWKGGEQVF